MMYYMSPYSIHVRPIALSEIGRLKQFLYAAIFVPPGIEPPPFSVVELPELKAYVADFGSCPGDFAFVAAGQGQLLGAAWCRLLTGYHWLGGEYARVGPIRIAAVSRARDWYCFVAGLIATSAPKRVLRDGSVRPAGKPRRAAVPTDEF